MINILKISSKDIFPIGLIFLLAFSRIIPHPPNFTPIIAVAIMSSYFFKNIYFSFIILLISMFVSDIFIGFYENILFVYMSLLLISFTFYKISEKINFKNLFVFSFFGSLIFYLVSNFGVWALGSLGAYNVPYEKSLNGLIECYILAIPFFGSTFLSTLIFSYASFLTNYIYRKKII